jgi:hypothetical protein
LVGLHILNENDVRTSFPFDDGVATEIREIDLHLPKQNSPYNFMSYAIFTQVPEYQIPFRSLCAADIDNLMMAGRCFSATHVGLGSPRVMNTAGQMGVATGYASALCMKYNVLPKAIYTNHISELKQLIGIQSPFKLPETALIMDNSDVKGVNVVGNWVSSNFNKTYYGTDYLHDNNTDKGMKRVEFSPPLTQTGNYDVYIRFPSGPSRSSTTNVIIQNNSVNETVIVDQKEVDGKWVSVGTYNFTPEFKTKLIITNANSNGHVIVDAVAFVPKMGTSTQNQDK